MDIDESKLPGPYLLWPGRLLNKTPEAKLPNGYQVRLYSPGDEAAMENLLTLDGWVVQGRRWQEYKDVLLPGGLFVAFAAGGDEPVATAGAVHNPNPGRKYFPFGGELANVFVHPEHRQKGLGRALSALAVGRLIAAGYDCIRVCVLGQNLPALRLYLKLGFVPFLHRPNLLPRWQRICDQLGWPFIPDQWPLTLEDNLRIQS